MKGPQKPLRPGSKSFGARLFQTPCRLPVCGFSAPGTPTFKAIPDSALLMFCPPAQRRGWGGMTRTGMGILEQPEPLSVLFINL